MTRSKKNPFLELTWGDLSDWAGERVLSRGRSYKKRVQDLQVSPKGGLLSWVRGSERYATHVWMNQAGALECSCTCPYSWGPCKHAVATILVHIDTVKSGDEIPSADDDDRRLALLSPNTTPAEFGDTSTDEPEARSDSLRPYLGQMEKEQLVDLLLELARGYPEIRKKLQVQQELATGDAARLVQSIREDMEGWSDVIDWDYDRYGHISEPDYSQTLKRLRKLLQTGHFDEIVSLGKDLLSAFKKQVEMFDHEGEIAFEAGECMEVVFDAVGECSFPPVETILWIIEAFQDDEYGILGCIEDPFEENVWSEEVWGKVAATMDERLQSAPVPTDGGSFSDRYNRRKVMRWLITALEKASKKQEVIPLLEREAPITDCYDELVTRLLASRRKRDAHRWAMEGFEKTIEKRSGIAWGLEDQLREMAQRAKDHVLVAAYRALEFFRTPSEESYASLEKASTIAGVWTEVRQQALRFLETGEKPYQKTETQKAEGHGDQRKAPEHLWPLPLTGLETHTEGRSRDSFPNERVLIDIAIREQRIDDVLKWYEALVKNSRYVPKEYSLMVATAVKKSHPDVSLNIWKHLAESKIALVKPSAYQISANYLKNVRDLLSTQRRRQEWDDYIAALRTKHKAKRRLMEILDSLENKKIIGE